MCSISMLAPLFCGAASRRGAAAKPAPRPRVFLRKSRLLFMVLPLRELAGPSAPSETQRTLERNRYTVQAADIKVVALAISPTKMKGETQIRRMLKDAS